MGVACWEELDLGLRPLSESLAVDAAGPNGDFRLRDLISLAERVPSGIQKRDDAILLIRLQQRPADRHRDDENQCRSHPDLPSDATEEHCNCHEWEKRRGRAEVR